MIKFCQPSGALVSAHTYSIIYLVQDPCARMSAYRSANALKRFLTLVMADVEKMINTMALRLENMFLGHAKLQTYNFFFHH